MEYFSRYFCVAKVESQLQAYTRKKCKAACCLLVSALPPSQIVAQIQRFFFYPQATHFQVLDSVLKNMSSLKCALHILEIALC